MDDSTQGSSRPRYQPGSFVLAPQPLSSTPDGDLSDEPSAAAQRAAAGLLLERRLAELATTGGFDCRDHLRDGYQATELGAGGSFSGLGHLYDRARQVRRECPACGGRGHRVTWAAVSAVRDEIQSQRNVSLSDSEVVQALALAALSLPPECAVIAAAFQALRPA